MAKGVPQHEVFQAADGLLASGERPTTEKVRIALGRGSPNALAPMLDAWWAQLSQRVAQRLALPEVPEPIGAAFSQVWAQALAAGHVHAEAQIAPERAALADALAKVDAVAVTQQATVAALEQQLLRTRADSEAATAAHVVSEKRIGDLQREISAFESRWQELATQRDALEARARASAAQAEADRAAAATEREALQGLLRQVEDRAYGEVDRSRQETKSLKAQLAAQTREHALALRASERARQDAQTACQKAQRESAALQARVAVLSASHRAPAKRPVAKARISTRRPAAGK